MAKVGFCAASALCRIRPIAGLRRDARADGHQGRSKVLDITECAAPEAVASALGLPEQSSVVQIARLRIAGGRVMSYDLSYFPLDVGRRLREQDLARHDVFVLLERALGMPLGFADVTIEVAPADDDPQRDLA